MTRLSRHIALALTAISALLLALPPDDMARLGLAADSPWLCRLSYMLLHASCLHWAVNAWCLLTLAFLYPLRPWHIPAALAIAASVPPAMLSATPTVGLSGLCFALMGLVALSVRPFSRFFACVAAYIALGFAIPGVSAQLHLYCFIAALAVALLFTPLWTPKD